MTYGYTLELRTRALAFLDKGGSRKEVCEIFNISRKTLYNWIKLRQETGELKMKDRPLVRSSRKLTKERLLAYLEKHPDHYLKEIGAAFKVAGSSVFNALRKFGITRKKNDYVQRTRREQKTRLSSRNQRA